MNNSNKALQYLPTEAIFTLLLSSDFNNIINLCQTSSTINDICQDDHFWYQKFIQDFDDFPKLYNKSWRQSYEIMLQTNKILHDMIETNNFLLFEIIDPFIKQYLRVRTILPIRVILYYNNSDNTFNVEYDTIHDNVRQPRVRDEPIIIMTVYQSIYKKIVNQNEILRLIYNLLGFGMRAELKRNPEYIIYH